MADLLPDHSLGALELRSPDEPAEITGGEGGEVSSPGPELWTGSRNIGVNEVSHRDSHHILVREAIF